MSFSVQRLTLGAWRSPALMSWASVAVRMLGVLFVLPLVLRHLPAEEAAAWFLFQSLLALQALADFGFTPTFVRTVAYARAGGATRDDGDAARRVAAVIGSMRRVYRGIALGGFVLAAGAGSFAAAGPISQLAHPAIAWWSWLAVLASGTLSLWSAMFVAFLQGSERIALLQRWDAAIGLSGALAAAAAVSLGGGLAGLACASLTTALVATAVNAALAVRVAPRRAWTAPAIADAQTMRSVWPAAWRSGLGVALTFGAIRGSGVVYAQLVPMAEAGPYLLAQRLMQALSDFANVPFYTRLPTLARLYAENRREELVRNASAGMWRANALLTAGIVALGLGGAALLALIGSRMMFVDARAWWLLGAAILVERIGAMHLQLYSTTNRIVWHVANGVAGVLMLASMPFTYHLLGVPGLPLAILIGYAAFYAPFSMRQSYRAFSLTAGQIDLAASAAPLAVVLCGLAFAWAG